MANRGPGTIVAGRYRLGEIPVGIGGFGVVYLADDQSTRPAGRVAIKLLKDSALENTSAVGRLRREIQIAKSLDNDNLLPILDSGESAPHGIWYTMPIAQESLEARAAEGHIPDVELLEILTAIEAAVTYLHGHNALHRDLTPGNVLNIDGTWVVSDFGLSISADIAMSFLTASNVGAGTPDYMAPEQLDSLSSATVRSDVYGFGKLIQFLVERKRPRTAPALGNALRDVILRATQHEPERRFATVAELFLSARVVLATPPISQDSAADRVDAMVGSAMHKNAARDQIRWIATLNPDSSDGQHLRRAFLGLTQQTMESMWLGDGEAFAMAVSNFVASLESIDVGYETVDGFVAALARVDAATTDPSIRRVVLRVIAELGSRNDQWESRRVAMRMVHSAKRARLLEPTIAALRESGAAEWVLRGTDLEAMDQPLRGWLRDLLL